jgi:hypothetical protein
LHLTPTKRYEITVKSATLPHPGQNKIMFITSSLAENSQVGRSFLPLLCQIPLSADAGTYNRASRPGIRSRAS